MWVSVIIMGHRAESHWVSVNTEGVQEIVGLGEEYCKLLPLDVSDPCIRRCGFSQACRATLRKNLVI